MEAMFTASLTLLIVVVLGSSETVLTTTRESFWERSLETYIPIQFNPVSARSVLECWSLCQREPDCDAFCFLCSNNYCVVMTAVGTSVGVSANYSSACYAKVNTCVRNPGYSLVNGRCMKIHITDPVKTNFTTAATVCSSEGGHLFNRLTPQDGLALTEFFTRQTSAVPDYILLGAHNSGTSFYWTDGTEFTDNSIWGNSQPDNHGGTEDCLAVHSTSNKFFDVKCNLYGFLCQIEV